MKALRWSLLPLLVLGSALPLQAGELGMKAPKLQVAKWVKGDPVDVTDGKRVYVVEFWATWCGPCRESIPHLTAMQKKFGDDVVFVGVSIDDADTVKNVAPFVKKQGDKMAYHVAIDDDQKSAKAYMAEFGENGIPHAFVIDKQGKIVWHQNPMPGFGLEKAIEFVLAGKLDDEAIAQVRKQQEETQKELAANYNMLRDYIELVTSTGKESEAAKLGREIVSRAGDNRALMNDLAWRILTQKTIENRDLPLALMAAEKANTASGGGDPGILDTYALALYENGKKDKAVETQRKAIKLAKDAGSQDMLKELQGRLDRFEKGK